MSYAEVRESVGGKRASLLLGNGFSIAYSPKFEYPHLLGQASAELSVPVQQLFKERLKTANFEHALKTYDDVEWLLEKYGEPLPEQLAVDRLPLPGPRGGQRYHGARHRRVCAGHGHVPHARRLSAVSHGRRSRDAGDVSVCGAGQMGR